MRKVWGPLCGLDLSNPDVIQIEFGNSESFKPTTRSLMALVSSSGGGSDMTDEIGAYRVRMVWLSWT